MTIAEFHRNKADLFQAALEKLGQHELVSELRRLARDENPTTDFDTVFEKHVR